MSEFTISAANPIKFKVLTTTGTINDGIESIDANHLMADIGTFWNNPAIDSDTYSQPFNCSDTTEIQFIYDNSSNLPYVEILDKSGVFIDTLPYMIPTTNVYQVAIDWSNYDCNDCYQIRISTVTFGANFFNCADSGTFETGTYASFGFITGGSNVGTKSSTQAQSGTYSARIASPASPGSSERDIGYCTTAFSLSPNTIYYYYGYIFDDGTNPFVQDGRGVSIDITDFSDASTIYDKIITPSVDGRGAWKLVAKMFRTGSDTTGQIKIVTSAFPQSLGFIYLDEFKIVEGTTSIEALSEIVNIRTNHPYTVNAVYTSDDDAQGLYFGAGAEFTMRLPVDMFRFKMDDPDFNISDNTTGDTTINRSVSYKVYELRTGLLSPAMIETLCLALKMDSFVINGIPMVCTTQNISPEWEEDLAQGVVIVEVRVATYNYQNGSC